MNMMKRRAFDAHGNEIELDDDAILPDGCRIRIPMILRDSQPAADRAQAHTDHYAIQNHLGNHAPVSHGAERGYAEYVARMNQGRG